MITTATIIEALYYILLKTGETDKLKLVKLMYLADKYHLIRYGRTITNDDYYAMEYGPVGTTVKDVLSFNDFSLSSREYSYLTTLIEKTGDYTLAPKGVDIPFDTLSETDREALDFVIERFGKMSSWELSEYTHKYPEWLQYRELFEDNLIKRERIDTKELLSCIEGDPLSMPEEHIKESEKILTGDFD